MYLVLQTEMEEPQFCQMNLLMSNLQCMMNEPRLFPCTTTSDYFTWSDMPKEGMIYSGIDNVLENVNWFLQHSQCNIVVFSPRISDHCPIVEIASHVQMRRPHFKFLNFVTEFDDFLQIIAQAWHSIHIEGRHMFAIWRKLYLIQPAIKRKHRRYGNVAGKVVSARGESENVQLNSAANRFDSALVEIQIEK